MSASVLINNAIEPRPGRFSGRAGDRARLLRLRIKGAGDALAECMTEIMTEMARARSIHPVISAHPPCRR